MSSIRRSLARLLAAWGVVLIASCGGSEVDDEPRAVPFWSIDEVASQLSFGGGIHGDATSFDPAVQLASAMQQRADLEPHSGLFTQGMFSLIDAPAWTDPTFFESRTLIVVNAWNFREQILKISRLVETSGMIEVTFELCSYESFGSARDRLAGAVWFAIPKTFKPIVVLPLTYASTPPPGPWTPVGRCV